MKNVFVIQESHLGKRVMPDCYSNVLMLFNGVLEYFNSKNRTTSEELLYKNNSLLLFEKTEDISKRNREFDDKQFTYPRLLRVCESCKKSKSKKQLSFNINLIRNGIVADTLKIHFLNVVSKNKANES